MYRCKLGASGISSLRPSVTNADLCQRQYAVGTGSNDEHTDQPYDVAIVGSGMVGAALAALLRKWSKQDA